MGFGRLLNAIVEMIWLELVSCVDCWIIAGAAPWPAEAVSAAEHLRAVFYRQGFNDQEIVALSGSHTLGRAHKDRSGLGAPLKSLSLLLQLLFSARLQVCRHCVPCRNDTQALIICDTIFDDRPVVRQPAALVKRSGKVYLMRSVLPGMLTVCLHLQL